MTEKEFMLVTNKTALSSVLKSLRLIHRNQGITEEELSTLFSVSHKAIERIFEMIPTSE